MSMHRHVVYLFLSIQQQIFFFFLSRMVCFSTDLQYHNAHREPLSIAFVVWFRSIPISFPSPPLFIFVLVFVPFFPFFLSSFFPFFLFWQHLQPVDAPVIDIVYIYSLLHLYRHRIFYTEGPLWLATCRFRVTIAGTSPQGELG